MSTLGVDSSMARHGAGLWAAPSTPTASAGSDALDTIARRDIERGDAQRDFAAILNRAQQGSARTAAQANDPRAAAENFVSIALVQPVLKQLRSSNGAAAPFAPNATERAFRGMMDGQLAQRLVRSGNWSLVDRVEQSLRDRAAGNTGDAATTGADALGRRAVRTELTSPALERTNTTLDNSPPAPTTQLPPRRAGVHAITTLETTDNTTRTGLRAGPHTETSTGPSAGPGALPVPSIGR